MCLGFLCVCVVDGYFTLNIHSFIHIYNYLNIYLWKDNGQDDESLPTYFRAFDYICV